MSFLNDNLLLNIEHCSKSFYGNSYKSFNPGLAMDLGIQTIYQEIELIPYSSVAKNFFFGQET